MTHRQASSLLPVPHVLDHPSVSSDGSLEQRVAQEVAKGRSAMGCVPLLLQQEAALTIQALRQTVEGLGTGSLTPDDALAQAHVALTAWNDRVNLAQALLQADRHSDRAPSWWRFWQRWRA